MGAIKVFFTDTETTGVDPKRHAVIQIAGEIGMLEDGRYRAVEEFEYTLRPFPEDEIADEALAANGRTRPEIASFADPWVTKSDLEAVLGKYIDRFNKKDKAIFVAYNSPFDMEMLRGLWEKSGDKFFGSWFWYPDICVMRLAALYLSSQRKTLPDFRLSTVAEAIGIDLGKIKSAEEGVEGKEYHDAGFDVRVTKEIFLRYWRAYPPTLNELRR